jgi:hypothetical protein
VLASTSGLNSRWLPPSRDPARQTGAVLQVKPRTLGGVLAQAGRTRKLMRFRLKSQLSAVRVNATS